MHKPINILYQTFVWRCFLLIVISIISSCTQNKPDQPNTSIKKNTQKPPVTITGKATVVTLLDTCPSPRTIAIPQKLGDSYSVKSEDGSKTIKLLPPEKKSAGFFVSMQNFTTKNGFTHNLLQRGSIVDKSGNLWFGTYGGGVSRYDGKSFTNYTNVQGLSNNIASIFEDKSGNIWFATFYEGVSRYDGRYFRSYTTAQGLASNDVWGGIIEDKNGNLWFGTGNGVSRLNQDGKFTNYTKADGLAGNGISSILRDKSGNIWVGTWTKGVSRYDGRSFINYTAADGLADNYINCIFEDKNGNLWIGNEKGKISFLDGKKKIPGEKANFTNYTIAQGLPAVRAITEDKNGNLWFGTGGGGAFRLSWDKKSNPGKESFTGITTRQGLPANNVISILEDKSGNIWFGTADGNNGSISLLERDLKFLTSLTTDDSLLRDQIWSILEDEGQNLWFGTHGDGLLRLKPDGKSLLKYSASQGLPDAAVLSIFQDKSGNLWIGSMSAGVSRISSDGKSLTRYTTAQGLPPKWIGKIFEDKHGNFWFGSTYGGVSRLSADSKTLTTYTTEQGLPDNWINDIIEDKKGNIWLCTKGGVSRLGPDGKSFTNYTTEHGLSNNFVTSILGDKNGNIWFGTQGGVNRYDGQSFVSFTTAQGLSDDDVKDVVMDKEGIIWLSTNKGFTAIKGFVQIKDTLSASQKNLPPSNELSNSELEHNKFKPVFEIYNIKTGYPIEVINDYSNLLVTREGIIWAGTGSRERSVRFDYSGIHKNPNPPAVFIESIKINNEVISWYDLSYDKEKTDSFTKAPNIIEEVAQFGKILDEDQRQAMRKKFSGVKFDSIARFYPVPVNLVLPYGYNNITFDFKAIEPARLRFVRYQYMMEGYENEWSPVSDKTNATYGNIHEGSYTFKLKAQSPDGVWSKPLAYTFKVLPPWYRTWWAYVIYALGFATLIWIFAWYRSRRLKAENLLLEKKVIKRTQELEQSLNERYELGKKVESQQALLNERLRISRELHDDIGSTLGSISIYSEVAKKRTEKNENTNEVLSKIGFTSRELIDKMSDIVWSLNPSNEGFEQLQNRMMAFAAMMLAPRNIRYDFMMEETLKKLQFTGEQRKNIFLIFKEALYNIVKYADCKTVSIKLIEQNSDLIMIIQDDGKGFDVSQTNLSEALPPGVYLGGNGIKNMHARADVMNATLCIHSKINKGTTVQLTVHL